jgi:putative flavoprotein involved in K+ transport
MQPTPIDTQARHWLSQLEQALSDGDAAAGAALFADDGYWRDLVAFTWTIRTVQGREAIAAMLRATLASTRPSAWTLEGPASESNGVVEAWFRFDTLLGRGRGIVRLRDGRAWTLLTTLQELKGFEEPAGLRRPAGVVHRAIRDRRTWSDERADEAASLGLTRQPYCLIVGGGQGGIGLAARLKRLGVPTLVIDRLDRPGDAWRRRYKSLCLHDPVWYDHLPYLPFPDHWPVFTPKDKMGDWLEIYVKVMELAYWPRTECLGATHDPQADGGRGRWSVTVTRDGRPLVLQPTQLVIATGMSGLPQMPAIAGADTFAGTQVHSSAFEDGAPWRGKRCVVVGANNSAHDICVNLWEHEAAGITMIQRSSTMVARSETLQQIGWGRLFSEQALANGYTTDRADLAMASTPYRVIADVQRAVWSAQAEREKPFYDRLRQAGFRLNFGEDGTGIAMLYLRRGAGYYIDVGGSELVANGAIGVRSGVTVARLERDAVVLSDGSRLPADLVVYATGYGSMEGWAEKLVSPEVAARVGKCWGLGSDTQGDPGPWEGELRNMWKPTRQPGLWFHGGNLQQSRSYSLYLGLQIKARLEGLPTPVFETAP